MTNTKPSKRSKLSADDWLLAAIAAMASGGVENVKIERLAKNLGTSKGSFYWHFKDRPDLLNQLIRYWVTNGTQAIMDASERSKQNPSDKLRSLFKIAVEDPVGSLTSAQGEMAIRSWATNDQAIGKVVAKTDEQRIQYVAHLLQAHGHSAKEARLQSHQLYLMLLGFYAQASYAANLNEDARQALLNQVETLLS
jgi:AcrR family transcriptional regulator